MIRLRFPRSALWLVVVLAAASVPSLARAETAGCPTVQSTRTAGADPATVMTVLASRAAPDAHGSQLALTVLGGLFLIGALRTVSADKDSYPATASSRVQLNNAVRDIYYFFLNRPAWQVATAAVAPPVCARGGTASKVKTTATTQLFVNGVPLSLTATDDLWTLTGGNLAAGSVRRYLLLWTGATATTVVSVLASNDQVIANFADAAHALAACRFPSLPTPAIVGILSIANTTNAFIPGTTLLSATGVTDTYIDGIDDSVFQSALVTP